MAVKKKPAAAVSTESGELSLIRKLADILNQTGLTEIELDHKGARVRVAKSVQTAAVVHTAPTMHHAAPVAAVGWRRT